MLNRRALLKTACIAPLAHAAEPLRIWDVHCHLSFLPGDTPEQRFERMIAFMDRLAIERAIVHLGYPIRNNPTPEELRAQNDQVLRAVDHWPKRASGFVQLNPNYVEASLREFDRCVRDGPMVGVKLLIAKRCSAPELDPLIERATALHVPVLQHTWLKTNGNEPGESTPLDLAALAQRHPAATLIGAHTGGDWEIGIRAVRAARNVAVDLSGFNPTSGVVEMAVRELGPERIVFGSDAAGRSFASQLAKVMGAEIPDAIKRLILGGNLRRMLTPVFRSKGYAI